MEIALSQPLFWLMALSALGWTTSLLVAHRRVRNRQYRLEPDDERGDNSLVSIIIPARDEVENIEGSVMSALQSDHDNIEVIVLDDGSQDGTSELLANINDPKLRVIEGTNQPLPSGWYGKPWACHRASLEAKGAYLLFIDADVRIAKEAVSRALGYAQMNEVGLLSGFGKLDNRSLAERVLQPVVGGMILAGNPLSKVNDPRNERVVLANGQFMFFSRESYEVVGGHRAVQHNVLDDVGLAKAVVEADHRLGVVMMQRLFTVRMYSNGVDLWRGWRKNLFPGLNNSFVALFFIVVLSALFLLLPYVVVGLGLAGMVEGPAFYSALVAVVAIQGLRAYLDGVFGVGRMIGLLTHWIGSAAVLLLMIDSAVSTTRGTAVWKGRQIN